MAFFNLFRNSAKIKPIDSCQFGKSTNNIKKGYMISIPFIAIIIVSIIASL